MKRENSEKLPPGRHPDIRELCIRSYAGRAVSEQNGSPGLDSWTFENVYGSYFIFLKVLNDLICLFFIPNSTLHCGISTIFLPQVLHFQLIFHFYLKWTSSSITLFFCFILTLNMVWNCHLFICLREYAFSLLTGRKVCDSRTFSYWNPYLEPGVGLLGRLSIST